MTDEQGRIEARREERRKKKQEQLFSVTFQALGTYGDAMVTLGGRPAYARNIYDLRPQPGEKWVVQITFQNKQLIILRPIRKIEE